MDLGWIPGVLTFLSQIPGIGPIVAMILTYALPVSAVATAVVALWHAVIGILTALAMVPGLGGLSALATSLQTDEASVDSFINTYIVGILGQLSMLPVPTTAKAKT